MTLLHSAPTAIVDPRLEVVQLGPGEWRVCDAEVDANDATRVIGYVEDCGDHVELLWMACPGSPTVHANFAQAIAALSAAINCAGR